MIFLIYLHANLLHIGEYFCKQNNWKLAKKYIIVESTKLSNYYLNNIVLVGFDLF